MKKDIYTVPEGFFEDFNVRMDGKLRSERHRRRSLEGLAAGLCLCGAILLFAPGLPRNGKSPVTTISENDYVAETLDLYESDIFIRNFDFE